jgi:kynureninase
VYAETCSEVQVGVDLALEVEIGKVWCKSMKLGHMLMEALEEQYSFSLASPADPEHRGTSSEPTRAREGGGGLGTRARLFEEFLLVYAEVCSEVQVGVDVALEADIGEVRHKSMRLGHVFQQLMEALEEQYGFSLASPADPEHRGSQICFRHPEAYAIVQVGNPLRNLGEPFDCAKPFTKPMRTLGFCQTLYRA